MANVVEITKCGRDLGMDGEDLRNFIVRAQEFEREKRAHERDMHRTELEILERRAELSSREDRKSSEHSEGASRGVEFRPKLPLFDESKDQLDSYIERFERYANSQKWNKSTWSVYLGALLTGRALAVYVRLPNEQAEDYDSLKQALFKRFRLTEDGFRKKFFATKPEANETPAQFAFRLGTYLDRWVELSGATRDFDGLRELFLREQYLSNTPRDLSVFIRERSPKTMCETVSLTETFMDARNWVTLKRQSNLDSKTGNLKREANESDGGRGPKAEVKHGGQLTCYKCQGVGHIARECRYRKSSYTAFCKVDNGCPKFHNCSIDKSSAVLECGCNIPVVGSLHVDIALDGLNIEDGFVGTQPVRVMRDTGCTGVVVRRDLVREDQLDGRLKRYVMIDRTVRVAPMALIEIRSPYFSGRVEALCMPNPICDLVIGNIDGARLCPDTETVSNERVHDCVEEEPEVTSLVQTRSQSNKVKGITPLTVPRLEIPNVTREVLIQKQRADPTLKRFSRMPFGLINAGSSYNRMMRKMLNGMDDVDNFVDDVLVHTGTWPEHLLRLRELFERIRKANLTVRPSKCYFGYGKLEYVGHIVGQGMLETLKDKVEKIRLAPKPETKKELRSLLGLTGYYQKYGQP